MGITVPDILISLVENVGLIVAAGFLLLTISPLQNMELRPTFWRGKLFLVLFFGIFGIVGTYGGWDVMGSVANLRAMGVVTAGLLGGPVVGAGAGLIAGAHRILIDIGGFSAAPCGAATLIEGVAAGLISLRLRRRLDWRAAAIIAAAGETVHMALVLGFSQPHSQALELVRLITVPMVLGNALGAALFVHIIRVIFEYRSRRDSHQAETLLDIANRTVAHLRKGLTVDSAEATARIIYDHLPVAAVSITSADRVLSHVGEGSDHHRRGIEIQTSFTRGVIESGSPRSSRSRRDIGCPHPGCPFREAVVVPLRSRERVIGTLKLYGSDTHPLTPIANEVARGLADLFATQLELESIQVHEQRLAQAEIRRLQAQINPHFLFNALNTIASFCRTRPARARELILNLAVYTRKNLDRAGHMAPLREELDQVRAYLAIEHARFGDRIEVVEQIEDGCGDWPVPALMIQPHVENAIGHGLAQQETGGRVTIAVRRTPAGLEISVADNGAGMPADLARDLLDADTMAVRTDHIGIANCHQRLVHLFGPDHGLAIDSEEGRGTTVRFVLPPVPQAAPVPPRPQPDSRGPDTPDPDPA